MFSRTRVLFLTLLVIVVLVLAACGGDDEAEPTPEPTIEPTAEPTAEPDDTGAETDTETGARSTIVLADISDDPDKKFRRFQPVADYLAANLDEFGITEGVVKVAPDMETMITWFNDGEVDMAFDSVYPAMVMREEAGAQPVLRRWKDGISEYSTIIFVRADSGIETLDDLQGHLVAFDEPVSTSGFMVPFYYLTEAGYTASEKSSVDATVADDEIGYIFSNDDENTIQWTISGRVAAGAVDSDTFAEIPAETQEQLTILTETEPVPRQVAMARGDIDPDLLAAIIDLLVNLDETEEGREILDTFDTGQLDEFPQGADAALSDMEAMYELVTSR